MAKCVRRSSTLAIQLLLLLLSIYWCVNDGERRLGVVGGSSNDDVVVTMMSTTHCSSATIFGLLTADCTALNVSSVVVVLLGVRQCLGGPYAACGQHV